MHKYHNYNNCTQCRGFNSLEIKDTINLHIAECKTKCECCGFEDYWAHGFFESYCRDETKTEKAQPKEENK